SRRARRDGGRRRARAGGPVGHVGRRAVHGRQRATRLRVPATGVTRLYVSTVIDAAPADVWAALEPIERHTERMADALATRCEGEQERGVGTRFLCETKVGPIRLDDRMEVTEWRPDEAMGVHHRGIVTGTGRFTIQRAVGHGTRLSWE